MMPVANGRPVVTSSRMVMAATRGEAAGGESLEEGVVRGFFAKVERLRSHVDANSMIASVVRW